MKVTFIWIPKTAGTSIWVYLRDVADAYKTKRIRIIRNWYTENRIVTIGHISYKELVRKSIIVDDRFKFCFVRNPFDRFISLYAYYVRRGWIKQGFEAFCERFEHMFIPPVGLWHKKGYSIWNNQVDWIPDNMDFVGRYENLQSDFNKLCDIIKVKPGKLQLINSSNRDGIRYTKKTRKIVRNFYRKDIERFYK